MTFPRDAMLLRVFIGEDAKGHHRRALQSHYSEGARSPSRRRDGPARPDGLRPFERGSTARKLSTRPRTCRSSSRSSTPRTRSRRFCRFSTRSCRAGSSPWRRSRSCNTARTSSMSLLEMDLDTSGSRDSLRGRPQSLLLASQETTAPRRRAPAVRRRRGRSDRTSWLQPKRRSATKFGGAGNIGQA